MLQYVEKYIEQLNQYCLTVDLTDISVHIVPADQYITLQEVYLDLQDYPLKHITVGKDIVLICRSGDGLTSMLKMLCKDINYRYKRRNRILFVDYCDSRPAVLLDAGCFCETEELESQLYNMAKPYLSVFCKEKFDTMIAALNAVDGVRLVFDNISKLSGSKPLMLLQSLKEYLDRHNNCRYIIGITPEMVDTAVVFRNIECEKCIIHSPESVYRYYHRFANSQFFYDTFNDYATYFLKQFILEDRKNGLTARQQLQLAFSAGSYGRLHTRDILTTYFRYNLRSDLLPYEDICIFMDSLSQTFLSYNTITAKQLIKNISVCYVKNAAFLSMKKQNLQDDVTAIIKELLAMKLLKKVDNGFDYGSEKVKLYFASKALIESDIDIKEYIRKNKNISSHFLLQCIIYASRYPHTYYKAEAIVQYMFDRLSSKNRPSAWFFKREVMILNEVVTFCSESVNQNLVFKIYDRLLEGQELVLCDSVKFKMGEERFDRYNNNTRARGFLAEDTHGVKRLSVSVEDIIDGLHCHITPYFKNRWRQNPADKKLLWAAAFVTACECVSDRCFSLRKFILDIIESEERIDKLFSIKTLTYMFVIGRNLYPDKVYAMLKMLPRSFVEYIEALSEEESEELYYRLFLELDFEHKTNGLFKDIKEQKTTFISNINNLQDTSQEVVQKSEDYLAKCDISHITVYMHRDIDRDVAEALRSRYCQKYFNSTTQTQALRCFKILCHLGYWNAGKMYNELKDSKWHFHTADASLEEQIRLICFQDYWEQHKPVQEEQHWYELIAESGIKIKTGI